MVATINIQEKDVSPEGGESLGDADTGNEVNVFAKEVFSEFTFPPDVILVQEVLAGSAARLRTALQEKLPGCTYELAFPANQNPGGVDLCQPVALDNECASHPGLAIQRDTVILYNSQTMETVLPNTTDNNNDGHTDSDLYAQGYFRTRYPAAWQGDGYFYRDQAFACVREKAGTARLPIVSLHYVQERRFDTEAHNNQRKDFWSQQLANHLVDRCNWSTPPTTPDTLKVIGGDFNIKRCPQQEETPHCGTESPLQWWTNLKNLKGYTDSVYVKNTNSIDEQETAMGDDPDPEDGPRLDFVFVNGSGTCTATADTDYPFPPRTNSPTNWVYYSDHAYVKAMLGDSC